MVVQDLLKNDELYQKVIDSIGTYDLERFDINASEVKKFIEISKQSSLIEAANTLSLFPKNRNLYEAIIEEIGYPTLLIKNGTFDVATSAVWADRLRPHKTTIDQWIPSVGKIEFADNPLKAYAGTGWLVDNNIVVTNRHVASLFASLRGEKFTFTTNQSGLPIELKIDFREEYDTPIKEEFEILEVLYIEPGGNNDFWNSPDLAFLKVRSQRFEGSSIVNLSASPIPLATELPADESEIVVIGYPWDAPDQINPQLGISREVVQSIFGDVYNVKKIQPGLIKSINSTLLTHNTSTLAGNSGSVVLDFKTGKAVGLHWGGETKVANYAVPSTIIEQRLHDLKSGNIRMGSIAESTIVVFPTVVDLETVDSKTPIELEDSPCISPLDDASLEDLVLEAVPFPTVNMQLPISGMGYYSYAQHRYKQFGLPETIQAIEKIGEMWFSNHRSGPVIGVGNISKQGGGPVPPHKSHQTGLDVDFRLLRTDGARIGITFRDPSYSLTRTQKLVDTILSNPILRVNTILCNDNRLKGVKPWPGHDNHLHVRFTK